MHRSIEVSHPFGPLGLTDDVWLRLCHDFNVALFWAFLPLHAVVCPLTLVLLSFRLFCRPLMTSRFLRLLLRCFMLLGLF